MAKPRKIKKVTPDYPINATAARVLRTRLAEFFSHWSDPNETPTAKQLHDLRIAGKRLRYSAEQVRELYPDRLTFLIELLRFTQDLLGEVQDCVTQRLLIAADVERLRRRQPNSPDIPVLEKICAAIEQKQATLYAQFREIWQGMTQRKLRKSLKAMIARPKQAKHKGDAPALHLVNPG
jgi:CHAD domain-containing protein